MLLERGNIWLFISYIAVLTDTRSLSVKQELLNNLEQLSVKIADLGNACWTVGIEIVCLSVSLLMSFCRIKQLLQIKPKIMVNNVNYNFL